MRIDKHLLFTIGGTINYYSEKKFSKVHKIIKFIVFYSTILLLGIYIIIKNIPKEMYKEVQNHYFYNYEHS